MSDSIQTLFFFIYSRARKNNDLRGDSGYRCCCCGCGCGCSWSVCVKGIEFIIHQVREKEREGRKKIYIYIYKCVCVFVLNAACVR